MAIIVTINGTDRTSSCDLRSITVNDSITNNSDTLDMDVSISTTDGWRPKAGNPVVISNGTTKEFGGIIEDVDEALKSPSQLRYHCSGKDYTYLFDKYLVVDESTAALSGDAWVTRIVNGYTTGFTAVNVTTGPSISPQRFDYIAPSEAVRSIADRSGFGWYIDYDKDVHYFPVSAALGPTTSINIDSDITNYGDLHFTESVRGVKDRIYMKDYQNTSTSQWNRAFTGDGATRFFLLGQEPVSIDATQMTATVNGVALDLLVDFVDGAPGTTAGATSQLLVCFSNTGVRTSSGNAAFTSTQTLTINYNFLKDTISTVNDAAAQTELASREGGDGIHEYAIADAGLTAPDGSNDLATLAGNLALARYAFPRVTGNFETFVSGWRAGQVFDITTTKRMMAATTSGWTDTFTVQSVKKTIVNHPSTGSPTFRSIINFADGILGI